MEIRRCGSALRIAETGYRKAGRVAQCNAAVAVELETTTFRGWR
jgi:hypothetical protein